MQRMSRYSTIALLALVSPLAQAQALQLTIDVPACRAFPGAILPGKYNKLAKSDKGYAWLSTIKRGDHHISGNGGERADGSGMYDWLDFFRTDIDNDGYCDWYLNAGAPMSTGGDRDSINTIYLGRRDGWLRIGAMVPGNKPDELGFGETNDKQNHYLFGEEIAVIHDKRNKMNYLIGFFANRHMQRDGMPGYRVQVWDADKETLRMLDKWAPKSKAAEVYAFFKAHGARIPSSKKAASEDTILRFDSGIEAFELERACDRGSLQRSAPDLYGAVSRHLLARCKAK